MKKTWVIYVLLVVFGMSVVLDSLALVSAIFVHPYYGGHTILNLLATIFVIPDIIFSAIYFSKLFYTKQSIVFWTNVVFGYSVIRSIFSIICDVIAQTGTTISNIVELGVVMIIWYILWKYFIKLVHSYENK